MTVAEFIVNYLSEIGVTHIFGVSGGMCMYLIDAVNKNKNIKFIHMLHEQSAVIAADAYAQYKNELGVVIVTNGAGALNCLTGVAASYIDSTPLLIISGQCKTQDIKEHKDIRSKGVGEIDTRSIIEEITKSGVMLRKYPTIDKLLPILIEKATTGRKAPVWLEIPIDIQKELVNG